MRRFVPALITLSLAVGFTQIGQTRGRARRATRPPCLPPRARRWVARRDSAQ
jgi:hypothetical protein